MNLLIDFGNTRCKWAVSTIDGLQGVSAHQYTHKEITLRAEEITQVINFAEFKQIHIVSVLGETFEQVFKQKLASLANSEIIFHRSQKTQYGVTLSYDQVQTYGVDRYAALVAAHHQMAGHKIVIDCGTATTIDVINEDGVHAGGLIMPGVGLMVEMLANKATGIPMSDTTMAVKLLCDNTEQAVTSGCMSLAHYGVNGIIEALIQQVKIETHVFITGGASQLIQLEPCVNANYVYRPHLVLEGIQVMQN